MCTDNNHIHSTTGHHSCLQQTARDNHIAHHGIQSSRHNPQPVFTQTHTGKHTMQSHQVLLTHPSPYTSHTTRTPSNHAMRTHSTSWDCTVHYTSPTHQPPPPVNAYHTQHRDITRRAQWVMGRDAGEGWREGEREVAELGGEGDGRVLEVGSRTRSRCRGA